MASILLVRSIPDSRLAGRLAADLERRGFPTREVEPGLATALPSTDQQKKQTTVVVVMPLERPNAAFYAASLDYLEQCAAEGLRPILIARHEDVLPSTVRERGIEAVVRTRAPGLPYDTVFEDLFQALVAPLSAGVSVIVRPESLEAPVSVASWMNDLFVTDEHFGHVVRIDGDRTQVALPGLDSPHDIHLDRQKLLVANKGADQILLADVTVGGALDRVRELGLPRERSLLKPHGVHQSHHVTAIADTDNNRVVFTRGDPWVDRQLRWENARAKDMQFPIGVCSTAHGVWTADTFNHRLLLFGTDGKVACTEHREAESYPVGVTANARGDILVVTDETLKRVEFFSVAQNDASRRELTRVKSYAARPTIAGDEQLPLGTPCGVAVNRDNRLAIADRERACIWLLHLDVIPGLEPAR